jgi:hypothetical protein
MRSKTRKKTFNYFLILVKTNETHPALHSGINEIIEIHTFRKNSINELLAA